MNARQFIQWQDLLVLVDNGSFSGPDYVSVEGKVRDQAKSFPGGVAIMTILPPDARPPPDDVKRVVKAALMRSASLISCLGYAIEATGFRGVAARATLVGMKVFSSRPYPIYVELSVQQAVARMMAHMANRNTLSVDAIIAVINEARMSWGPPPPARPTNTELTMK